MMIRVARTGSGESGRVTGLRIFIMDVPQGEFPTDRSSEHNDRLRVVTDAVIGGGMDLRVGEVVSRTKLGSYASVLLETGAVEPVEESPASRIDLR